MATEQQNDTENKSTVYFAKSINTIISELDLESLGQKVGIKINFGEKGCITYLDPALVREVYDAVINTGREAALIETNVLYKGERTHASTHTALAKEHGFDFAPIDILDGEDGDQFTEIGLENGLANPVKIATNLKNYDSLIILSHFKGHIAAGFGGAFKNTGMGFGSRAGKLHMHASVNPSVNEKKCIGCGKCIEACDYHAIQLNDENKAHIDSDKCVGCAMCIATCPTGAVQIPWGSSTSDDLQKKIVDYTEGVFRMIPKEKCLFINVMQKITEECDCYGKPQEPMMQDVGILYSRDPVALDRASLDLAEQHSDGAFDKINTVNKYIQCDYAHEKGLGSNDYELLDCSKSE